MAKVKGVSVRLKGALKDGTENIVIQINAGADRRTIIKTGVSVRPDRFVPDDEWYLLKKGQKGEMSGQEIDDAVTEMYNKVTDLILGYEKAGYTNWTIKKLKKDLNNKPQSAKFSEFMDRFIEKRKKISTNLNYLTQQRFIKEYCGKEYETLDCSDIDFDWVVAFRDYCRDGHEKGLFRCSDGTLRKKESLISGTLRLALKEGLLMPEQYPYGPGENQLLKIPKNYEDRQDYRIINTMRMKQFVDYRCETPINRNIDWKIFMLQLLSGHRLAYENIAKMKKSDIVYKPSKDGVIVQMLRYISKTRRTEKFLELTPEMLQVINYLQKHYTTHADYLFPIIQQNFESEKELDNWVFLRAVSYRTIVHKRCKIQPQMKGKWNEKEKLNLDYIKSIMNIEFFHNPRLLAKMVFLFSYYAQGLNLADMLRLKYSHIIEREKLSGKTERIIKIKRKKTGAVIEITINENLQRVIDFFEQNEVIFPRVDGFILPLISDEKILLDENTEYEERRQLMGNINRNLKSIAKELRWPKSISEKFSSYFARHSFATHLISVGVNSALVKEALGHKNLETTQTYIHSIEKQAMESKVTQALVS